MGVGWQLKARLGFWCQLQTRPRPSPGLCPHSHFLLISSASHDLWINKIKQGCWLLGCPGEPLKKE